MKKNKNRQNKKGRLFGAVAVSGLIMASILGMKTSGAFGSKEYQEVSASGELSGVSFRRFMERLYAGASADTEKRPETEEETDTEIITEPETETDSENSTETGTEMVPENSTETGTETEAQMDTEIKAENGCGTETEIGPESGNEAETGNGSEIEEEMETEIENEIDTEAKTEADSEEKMEETTESKPVGEESTETEADVETESEWETETETDVETESEWETEADRETESEWETETETDKETESEWETETETDRETESEWETETEADKETESEWETEIEADKETESEWTIETDKEQISERNTEAGTEKDTKESEEGMENVPGPGMEESRETDAEKGTEQMQTEEVGEDPAAEPDREPGENPEPEPDRESGENPEPEPDREPGENPESEADQEPGENPEPEPDQEPDENPEPEADQEPGENPEPETNQESGENPEPETDQGSGENPEPETDQEPGENPEPGTEAQETDVSLEKIQRGVHYNIRGDENAWYRDDNDLLWVRRGTGVYIEMGDGKELDQLKTFTGASVRNDLQQDGVLTFQLQKTNEDGRILTKSEIKEERYYVDGEAPQASIVVEGAGHNGVMYAAGQMNAAVSVEPDGKSGLKAADYVVLRCEMDGTLLQQPEEKGWTRFGTTHQMNITEEGTYQIFVRTEDNVGNLAFSRSSILCVDSSAPEITVEGVENQTANAETVKLKITVNDSHFKPGSMHVELMGMNGGKTPAVSERKESEQNAVVEYFDFPRQKGFDDVYHLKVEAEDLAGNMARTELEFSVNRFGSVYDLSETTRKNLQEYFWKRAEDIVFYETNIDYVGESQIFCRRDGKLQELSRGTDYQVTMEGDSHSWKRYQYTVPASFFAREGVYELLLSSNDQAENKSDTGIQGKRVAFVLDWTAPQCIVTGVEKQQIYEAEAVTACLIPQDNTGIRVMRVYHNSELIEEQNPDEDKAQSQKNSGADKEKREEDGEKSSADETVKVTLPEAEDWQTLQVYLCDMAGNEYWSPEIPVYISTRTKREDVPLYRKIKESAQEIVQRSSGMDKVQENDPDSLRMSDGEKPEAGNKNAEYLNADNNEERDSRLPGADKIGSILSDGKRREGVMLLVLGGIMLAVTVIACSMGGNRWKKAVKNKKDFS